MRRQTVIQITLLILVAICNFAYSMDRVAHNKIDGNIDDENYIVELLKLSLSESGSTKYIEAAQRFTQAKVIASVENGDLDVMWAATSKELESRLEPIRIPLLKGLLGYRIPLIKRENRNSLNGINSLSSLRKVSMGQGRTWADTQILKSADINVVTANKYKSLFFMLEGERFDMFPRGVTEIWNEIDTHRDLNLIADDNIVLEYKMPAYFFVSKDNISLKNKIEYGLLQLIDNGKFDELFYSQEFVKTSIAKANLKNRSLISITNPYLPKETPLANKELWYNPFTY